MARQGKGHNRTAIDERVARPASEESDRPDKPLPAEPGGFLSEDDAISRHPREWILMLLTREPGQRVAQGRLLAHSHSRDEVEDRLVELRPLIDTAPNQFFAIFDGYPRARTGEEFRAAIAAAVELEHDPTGLDRW